MVLISRIVFFLFPPPPHLTTITATEHCPCLQRGSRPGPTTSLRSWAALLATRRFRSYGSGILYIVISLVLFVGFFCVSV